MENGKIKIKTPPQIKIMEEGGEKLSRVKNRLIKEVGEGVGANSLEVLANKLIKKTGGKPSFREVPGYSWAICVNVNEGVVHGVPHKETVFKKGDVVSVDIGLFYKGFHTDTSFTVGVKPDSKTEFFLERGREALNLAIDKARAGNRIYDISRAIQEVIESASYSVIRALVGHGVGRELHEPPPIPCFVSGKREESPKIPEGAVLAIEVMYAEGKPDVKVAEDGWTIRTQDGKIAGLFEETVAVTEKGPKILTNLE